MSSAVHFKHLSVDPDQTAPCLYVETSHLRKHSYAVDEFNDFSRRHFQMHFFVSGEGLCIIQDLYFEFSAHIGAHKEAYNIKNI